MVMVADELLGVELAADQVILSVELSQVEVLFQFPVAADR
jgi:hypothetical protein